ncbi:MAG: PHP domain-containing protein [Anaerolineae bacterium]|nr:PHP domain-containing protein [Anaerolineae bacterium]
MFFHEERVDLHIHTTASDGLFSPSEVVRLAVERNIAAIAIADHDTIAGIAEAQAAAIGTGLEVVPGVELSSEGEWGDFHILGLYVNPQDGSLQERLKELRAGRAARARRMLERLAALGKPLEWEQVVALAGDAAIGRLHIARCLVQRGYVADISEAFQRYLGWGGPAYVSVCPDFPR